MIIKGTNNQLKMNKDIENLNNYAIDSCKIRIKREQITILNSDILDDKSKIIISNSSGEIISEDKIKSFSTEINFGTYKIKIALVSYHNFQRQVQEEFLEIYLHSKILEQDYFQGFTDFNIGQVYERLISQNVFFVSRTDFMKSCVNDVDIKFDFISDTEHFDRLTKELSKRALESKKLEYGVKLWENGNLTFNRRESSSINHPFVKLYNKELEATQKNFDFFEANCNLEEYKRRRRLEVTIKKTAEIKKVFDIYESSLNTLLHLTQTQMKDYVQSAVNRNILKTQRVEKSAIKNNNLETLIHIHFSNSIDNQGQTFQQVLNAFLEHFDDDTKNKYRMKLKAKKWAENKDIEPNDIENEVERLLNLIGVK